MERNYYNKISAKALKHVLRLIHCYQHQWEAESTTWGQFWNSGQVGACFAKPLSIFSWECAQTNTVHTSSEWGTSKFWGLFLKVLDMWFLWQSQLLIHTTSVREQAQALKQPSIFCRTGEHHSLFQQSVNHMRSVQLNRSSFGFLQQDETNSLYLA